MNPTPEEVSALLGRLGIIPAEAARLLWTADRSVRRWLSGEREISGPAWAYLKLLERAPELIPIARDIAAELKNQGAA